jgi:hypothetical protein
MQMLEKEQSGEKKNTGFTWFLLAFLVGLGLRLWRLGEMNFTLAEAQVAQGAWLMSMGDASGLPGNMSYAGLSALLFYLFEPSFFFARLMPALLGSSLILLPWFWRDRLGEKVALVLAFGLALDPILLSFSRQIVTPVFVLAGLAWAVTALKHRRPVSVGIMLAVAFLGGYSFWIVVPLGLVVLIVWRASSKNQFDFAPYRTNTFLLPFVTSFIVSLILVSSAFLLCTEGLGGIGTGLVELFHLFGIRYEIPAYQPIIVAIAYSILPLFFAIWNLVDELRNRNLPKNLPFLVGWALSLLTCVLLGRQDLGLLVFATVFAWLGASGIIARIFEQGSERREIVVGVTAFQIVIMVYIQMVSGRLTNMAFNTQEFRLAFFALLAGILLLVISTLLVGMGWSRQVSGQAIRNSLLVILVFLTVGLSLRSVRSQQESTTLSLLAGPIVMPNDDVAIVMDEIDRNGRADKTEITYDLGILEQQFGWFFREQVDWRTSQNVLQADLVLSESEPELSVADTYRGRNVVLYRQIDKQVVKPGDFLKTLLGEALPFVSQKGVLWVRLNLFTGAN